MEIDGRDFDFFLRDTLTRKWEGKLEKSKVDASLTQSNEKPTKEPWKNYVENPRVFGRQHFGTCVESSRFLSEWGLVSEITRLRLYKHAIERSINSGSIEEDDYLLSLARGKVISLQNKIEKEKAKRDTD